MLVGKVKVGKTAVMNTFLRSSEENKKTDPECQRGFLPGTEKCKKEEVKIGGRNVVIVDTPGLCNADKEDEEVVEELKKRVSLAGPYVILFVLSCLDKFHDAEKGIFQIIKNTFGENVVNRTMVLFTHGDEMKNTTIEKFVEENSDLKNTVNECNGGCHVIDNTDQNLSQVTELLKKIDTMVQKNGGKPENEGKRSGVRRKIALAVNGSALAGAGLGAAVSHFAGSIIGIPAGLAAGAAVGGALGGVGIVTAEHLKAKRCVMQ
ncbi:MAG: GTPase [Sarcina sp.]